MFLFSILKQFFTNILKEKMLHVQYGRRVCFIVIKFWNFSSCVILLLYGQHYCLLFEWNVVIENKQSFSNYVNLNSDTLYLLKI